MKIVISTVCLVMVCLSYIDQVRCGALSRHAVVEETPTEYVETSSYGGGSTNVRDFSDFSGSSSNFLPSSDFSSVSDTEFVPSQSQRLQTEFVDNSQTFFNDHETMENLDSQTFETATRSSDFPEFERSQFEEVHYVEPAVEEVTFAEPSESFQSGQRATVVEEAASFMPYPDTSSIVVSPYTPTFPASQRSIKRKRTGKTVAVPSSVISDYYHLPISSRFISTPVVEESMPWVSAPSSGNFISARSSPVVPENTGYGAPSVNYIPTSVTPITSPTVRETVLIRAPSTKYFPAHVSSGVRNNVVFAQPSSDYFPGQLSSTVRENVLYEAPEYIQERASTVVEENVPYFDSFMTNRASPVFEESNLHDVDSSFEFYPEQNTRLETGYGATYSDEFLPEHVTSSQVSQPLRPQAVRAIAVEDFVPYDVPSHHQGSRAQETIVEPLAEAVVQKPSSHFDSYGSPHRFARGPVAVVGSSGYGHSSNVVNEVPVVVRESVSHY